MLTSTDWVRHFHYGASGLRLNARVSMTGHETRRGADYVWDGLRRGDDEFILWQQTLAGAGALRVGKQNFRVLPGQAMLLEIPQDHCYRVDPAARQWEFFFLILRGGECMRLARAILENNAPVVTLAPDSGSQRAVREILATAEEEADPVQLSILAYGFLLQLAAECQAQSGGAAGIPPELAAARRLALREFHRGISVGELADCAHLSYAHFIREFQREFGRSPGEFLRELQMEKAVNLLQNSDFSIKAIAAGCGFASAGYFGRAFHARFGVAPGRYRNAK